MNSLGIRWESMLLVDNGQFGEGNVNRERQEFTETPPTCRVAKCVAISAVPFPQSVEGVLEPPKITDLFLRECAVFRLKNRTAS